jgi:hypothetical protein
MKLIINLTFVLLLTGFINQLKAQNENVAESLVKQVWTNFASNNTDALSEMMVEGFQSMHQDGPRNKAEELDIISKLKLGEYSIMFGNITESDNVLMVSYKVTVKETIKEQTYDEITWRFDVFGNVNGEWKWFSHVNLLPLKN